MRNKSSKNGNRRLPIEESPILKRRQWVKRQKFYLSWPFLGSIAAFILMILGYITSAYMNDLSGMVLQKYYTVTQNLGFKVKSVVIQGCSKTPKDALNNALQLQINDAILKYDMESIKERLQQIEWIKDAVVYRQLPDQFYIHIVERDPIAVWFEQKKKYLIDDAGIAIYISSLKGYEKLPQITGPGAPEKASGILNELKYYPLILDKLSTIVRVRKRRWDLILHTGVIVKLPESDFDKGALEKALKVLVHFLKNDGIKIDQVKSIDLRLSDKYYIERK
jgi:cell division protein FtsQ